MKILSLLTLGLALFTTGCEGMLKGKQAAEQGVADFHKLYNEGKVAEIYAAGDARFKGATTEQEFLQFEAAVQRKLGKVKQTSTTRFNIRTVNGTATVVLTQTTTFEQGSGTEVFTFQMDGDKAVLVGYNISSKELILK
jgi:pyruvate/2-oxoglutarate dehydrogenase complex dihydrolipoamide dehydrogenase (E3) component